MIDRFQPLMLSRGAAAMDTFDFALVWDPMASRLTRRTGGKIRAVRHHIAP